jgi:hypothetical protein
MNQKENILRAQSRNAQQVSSTNSKSSKTRRAASKVQAVANKDLPDEGALSTKSADGFNISKSGTS